MTLFLYRRLLLPLHRTQSDKNQADAVAEAETGVTSAADTVAAAAPPTLLAIPALERMEHSLGLSQWVVPINKDAELEQCLKATVKAWEAGLDDDSIRRFLMLSFRVSFERLLDDGAVASWNPSVMVSQRGKRKVYNESKL